MSPEIKIETQLIDFARIDALKMIDIWPFTINHVLCGLPLDLLNSSEA